MTKYLLILYSTSNVHGYYLLRNAWMTTASVNCDNTQNCFGCCYGSLPDEACQNLKCDDRRDMVIGCSKFQLYFYIVTIELPIKYPLREEHCMYRRV